jgi:hAT family C-terminal dimerisation region
VLSPVNQGTGRDRHSSSKPVSGSHMPSLAYISDDSNDGFEASICGAAGSDSDTATEDAAEKRKAVIIAELERQLANYKVQAVHVGYTTCPLLWWRTIGAEMFPLLAPVARYCLSMLASSAAVERAFKCAKFVSREERGNTGDDSVDLMAVLAYSYKKDPAAFLKRIGLAQPGPIDASASGSSAH